MASKVKTRILIISDTHNRPLQNENDAKRPFREPLPAADVLIHCGDLTMEGSLQDYHATLDAIKHVQAPLKLVIAGNHDLTLDGAWMRNHPDDDWRIARLPAEQRDHQTSREFWTGAEGRARREGVVFLDEGTHVFELENGARLKVYASPYTPDFWDWGFAYAHNEDRFNPPSSSLTDAKNIASNAVPSFEDDEQIDVMITHGPPFQRLDLTASGVFAGCPHLLRALMRSRPLVHCFGHIHEGWGAEVVNWAEEAGDVAVRATTQEEWSKGGWKAGTRKEKGIVSVPTDEKKQSEERSLHVDVAQGSEREFERGKQTVLVNAAIMDIHYEAVNAPVLVDVDLSR